MLHLIGFSKVLDAFLSSWSLLVESSTLGSAVVDRHLSAGLAPGEREGEVGAAEGVGGAAQGWRGDQYANTTLSDMLTRWAVCIRKTNT